MADDKKVNDSEKLLDIIEELDTKIQKHKQNKLMSNQPVDKGPLTQNLKNESTTGLDKMEDKNADNLEQQDEIIHEEEEQEEVVLLGALLKKQREELSISLEDAAHKLNLQRSHLVALEEDRFDELPSVLFCQGYLRNYSNLLGLDSDHLVEVLNGKMNVKSMRPLQPEEIPKIKPMKVKRDNKLIKAMLGIALPVLALVVIYKIFLSDNVTTQSADDELSEMIAADSALESDSLSTTDLESNNSAFSNSELVNDDANNLDASSSDQNITPLSATTDTAAHSTDSVNNSSTQTNVVAVSSITAQATPTTTQSAGTDSLQIQYLEDAWTEVYDANDKRLVFETKQAGSRLELNGQKPFYVKLGRPEAAMIYLNGNIVSIKTDRVNSPISFVLE